MTKMKLYSKNGAGTLKGEEKIKNVAFSFLCSAFYEKFIREDSYTFKDAVISFIYDEKGLNSKYLEEDLKRLMTYIAKERTKVQCIKLKTKT